jgi:hypothetical protein
MSSEREGTMTGAIVIRWGASVAGREGKGLEVFGSAVQRFEEHLKAGRISSHREYFAMTGQDGGFMIIEGEIADLLAIVAEEETLALNAKAASIVQDFELQVFGGGTDQAVQNFVGTYASSMQELGYM